MPKELQVTIPHCLWKPCYPRFPWNVHVDAKISSDAWSMWYKHPQNLVSLLLRLKCTQHKPTINLITFNWHFMVFWFFLILILKWVIKLGALFLNLWFEWFIYFFKFFCLEYCSIRKKNTFEIWLCSLNNISCQIVTFLNLLLVNYTFNSNDWPIFKLSLLWCTTMPVLHWRPLVKDILCRKAIEKKESKLFC